MLGHLRFKFIDLLRATSVLEILYFLRETEKSEPEVINQKMRRSLDEYLRELRTESPLYKELEFHEFPIIDKAYANNNKEQLINKNYNEKKFRKKTGGSTGEPFVYLTGTESQSYLWAAILLSWETAGYKLGEPVAFLAGSSIFGSGWKQRIFYKLMNVSLLSAFNMTKARSHEYAKKIRSTKAKILYGYASSIHKLALDILEFKETPKFYLSGIICTAEVLTSEMRKDIELAFKAPCFSQYGCNDAGVSAYECENRNGFHLITTRCYPEIMPDGRLIATDMTNTAFFLPRYDSGDLVELSDAPCSCGRGFPLLIKVIGRSNDLVVDRNNKIVHSEFFSHLFREESKIKKFQITYTRSHLTINLHTNSSEQDWSNYINKVKAELEFERIEVVTNQPFAASKNGKTRSVVRLEDAPT